MRIIEELKLTMDSDLRLCFPNGNYIIIDENSVEANPVLATIVKNFQETLNLDKNTELQIILRQKSRPA